MKLKRTALPSFLFFCLALNSAAFATTSVNNSSQYKGDYKALATQKSNNHFEVIGALGVAKLNAGNGELGVTSSETDKLVQTNSNSWDAFTGQLGLGYVYYFKNAKNYSANQQYHSKHIQWFPSIEPELNVYHLASNSIKGNVWRFNSSNFNELTYDIPVHSTRLMLDAALTVATYKRLSVYALGGIGEAWNRLGYSDTDQGNSCTNQTLNLNSRTSSNFVWEGGAGLLLGLNNRVGLSLEYLYTDLGTVRTSATGSSGAITAPIISPAHFNLKSQAGLLGLHIAL